MRALYYSLGPCGCSSCPSAIYCDNYCYRIVFDKNVARGRLGKLRNVLDFPKFSPVVVVRFTVPTFFSSFRSLLFPRNTVTSNRVQRVSCDFLSCNRTDGFVRETRCARTSSRANLERLGYTIMLRNVSVKTKKANV